MIAQLPGCKIIPEAQNRYGDAGHALGLYRLHFCKTHDEYKLEALKKIVYEHASNAEIQTLCDEYDKKLVYELESLTKQE